ncbi:HET-domain-containing protein [Plenodomus tracheiphilus IPT5]|uniref:HET-domain-containing protein n=1 Tax=Plenodomus tracheiphilus IPT5 TaxID=1408161 RepID=A0A6A7AS80_9PLEO|nr:HET-domain-containing protein [Plenodomus tracheiphilus IPT5]
MHFANVAFLRQLSRRKQQANLKPPSEKSDLPLPFSRRSFIESSNQREPQGIREDSLGSLHSQGHVDYDEAYSNSRLANVYYFHSLQKEQYVPIPPLAMNRAQIQRKLPTTFVHPSLFNPKSSIRLLHMDSSPDPDTSNDIYCSLKSAEPWINDMKYVCLSYCWGVPTDGKQIFVRSGDGNYQPMDVTDNLYNALQGLRASPISVLYWIDAICIDQTNVTERGEQVGLMRDIYNKAAGVVVWLGPSTERLTAAVRIISNISERFQDDTYTTPDSILSPLGLNLTEEDTAHLQSYTEFSYEEIAHFFSLPWFRRVWVLQEAFSQGNITVRLGPHTLPWGSVILAALWQAQFTRSHTATSTTEVGELGNHHFLPELWLGLLHTRMPRGLSMMELTSRARDFEATDPRDKVFALLGLANDIGPLETRPSGLVPDYAKHKIEVYADFARSIILKTRKLEVLSMVNGFSPQNEMQDFFSWMPNLDASVATIRGLGFPEKYDASCSKEVDVDITGSTNDVANSLRLLGFHIDEAQMVTDQALSFSRDLKLYLDVDSTDAVTELWRSYCAPHANGISQKHRLRQYIELLTAAGFALPTGLSAQPLGKVVPSRHVPSVVADFAAYWARLDPEFGDFDEANRSELREHAKHGDADQFGVLTGKACHERKFVLTSSGRMGLCPRETGAGDNIVILYGGSVPYVLRAMPSGDWKFIGECYIDGIMFGEARDLQETEEVFSII